MEETILTNTELQMLLNNEESGYKYKERRVEQWRINYELYRDKVQINRLTQRQSVNLPIMKTQLRTLLKDIDDMPVIEFDNLDNDIEAQVFLNEVWRITLEENNAEIQDVVDKKQDFFFGRTFDTWQVKDGKIRFNIIDPEDILVDRYMNPYDIDSSRFLIHTHIFVPLSDLKDNPEYDQDEVKRLEEFFKSEMGIIKAVDNQNSLTNKNQKMASLGVADIEDPVLGETYVELKMHRVKMYDQKTKETEIMAYVVAEDQTILSKKKQEEAIGVTKDNFWRTHYNYNTWGDDIDMQDFWTDGIADIIRVPNQVANAWFSQEIERRTLSNFGMTFYDASIQADGFIPGTFEPKPFGFYPVPGNPNEFLKRVEIPMNDGNLESINYVTSFLEKATGATATQQGVQTANKTTLGEVQLAQAEAKERTQGMSKFYTKAWKDRATKFLKLIEAASDKIDSVKIYKKGRNSNDLYMRETSPKDWKIESGYRVRVWSQDEKRANDTQRISKLQGIYSQMPDNPKLQEVYKRKLLEFADLTPDEITSIMDYEKQKLSVRSTNPGQVMSSQPAQIASVNQPIQ